MSPSAHKCLDHGWSLDTQHLDSLKDVHDTFQLHPLQDDVKGNEHSSPPHARAAVHHNGPQRAQLAVHLGDLADELHQGNPRAGYTHFRPDVKVEVADSVDRVALGGLGGRGGPWVGGGAKCRSHCWRGCLPTFECVRLNSL